MRQDFTNQTALKMPKIMRTNLVCFETFRQMGACCFDTLSDTLAEFEKRSRKLSFHIFPLRSDKKDSVTLHQQRMSHVSMKPLPAGAIPANPSRKVSMDNDMIIPSREMRKHNLNP
ncbi:hypothetical protein [Candidatus Electronema sp. JM]|uniref:hypothetical protein n=1 Tax=Candidatus Electronema sp. JM TaxID=3401571 RepID=UPI003AA7F03E